MTMGRVVSRPIESLLCGPDLLRFAWDLDPKTKLYKYREDSILNAESAAKKLQLQEASRMASRGPRSTFFHLLFPITLVLSFTLFYLIPLYVVSYLEPSGVTDFIRTYLKGSVLVVGAATLIIYHKARLRILAPYVNQLSEDAKECSGR